MSAKKPFKKLIWAYDPFEGTSETHAAVAKALGYFNEKTKASIQPVYVLSPADLNLQMSLAQPYLKQYLPSVEKMLTKSLKEVQLAGLTKHEVVVQRTPLLRQAVNALLGFARTKHADVIVIGTHARKGLARLLLGSFTETLVLHSKTPVLVINPSAKPSPIRHILFPTDFGPSSQAIYKKVCGLARDLGAEITLLHVIPHPIEAVFQSGVFLLAGGWVDVPDYMKATEQRQMKVAERWKRDGESQGLKVSIYFDSGRDGVTQAILEHVKVVKAGLIAMGSQSGPAATALIGSVVREVMREAPCPVWVLRK